MVGFNLRQLPQLHRSVCCPLLRLGCGDCDLKLRHGCGVCVDEFLLALLLVCVCFTLHLHLVFDDLHFLQGDASTLICICGVFFGFEPLSL